MEIAKIPKGVYLHQSFHPAENFGATIANGLVIVENDKAFVADTLWPEQSYFLHKFILSVS